jgi:hypothetical protein
MSNGSETVANEIVLGGFSVNKSTLILAGVGGGLFFIFMLVGLYCACTGRICNKKTRAKASAKNGDYDGVDTQDPYTSGAKSTTIDVDTYDDEYHATDDDGSNAYFSDDGPQLTQTGTFNNRNLDLSKFVDVNYPHDEDTASSTDGDHNFDFNKCMAYVTKYLFAWKKENPVSPGNPQLDVEEYVAELEARWRLIDEELVGVVSADDLRAAVWNNDADYEGMPMPDGPLPQSLQDIVDDILDGVGLQEPYGTDTFTFWTFVNYLLRDADGIDYGIVMPPAPALWGHVGHR